MQSVPAPAFAVHLDRTPKQVDAIDFAFQLGYDFAGCEGSYDPPPAFDEAEQAAFRAGFSLGRERSAAFPDAPNDATQYIDADDFPTWADGISVGIPISPADDQWWLGFQLGLEGTPAAPPDDANEAGRAAFRSGHEIGIARYHEDCERDYRESLERQEWAFSDPTESIHEAEVSRVMGHRAATAAGC